MLKSAAPALTYESDEPCQIFEIVRVNVREKFLLGVIIARVEKPPFQTKILEKTALFFNENQKILAHFMASYYLCGLGESFGNFLPFSRDIIQNPAPDPKNLKIFLQNLSEPQQNALNFAKNRQFSLIFGDTGSGKTEIYFHLMADAINRGQNTLFLMPEIALTPQMTTRLENAFGAENIAIWHSKISKISREKIMNRLNKNTVKILLGTRSALFCNLQNLGQIIIDEEHDDSYKSRGTRGKKASFHARDLCIFLCERAKIRLVLGSATPSVTTYFMARKKHAIFRLKGRYFSTRHKILFENTSENLGQKALKLIDETLKAEKQAIIFVPTRANFKSLVCKNCGSGVKCKRCSVNLSLHEKQSAMICHYCGFKAEIPKFCEECFSNDFLGRRIGSVQVAKELKHEFPAAKIGIFDSDHISHKKTPQILKNFATGETDLLVGTQMLAKGHDYDVALVVVLGIDFVLQTADFRAFERTFSLLHQICGRAGRKNDGTTLISTANEPFIAPLMHDFEDALNFDISARKNFYPPFCKVMALHFVHKNAQIAENYMQKALNFLRVQDLAPKNAFEIIGFGENPIFKINNNYRYHIFVRSLSHIKTLSVLRALKTAGLCDDIDVDSLDLTTQQTPISRL